MTRPARSAVSVPSDDDARTRIFRAAEALVAEQGFEAISTRDIVAAAGVNIAAVNYHYGTKTRLMLDIFRTRATELNRERAALLRAAVDTDPRDALAILRALIEPSTLWISDDRRVALRFLNRARSEGPLEVRETIRTDVRHLRRFVDALGHALPAMPRDELLWRFHFALGVLHHNQAADYARLAILSDGLLSVDDREALLRRLLDFIAAGFGLPASDEAP